MDSTRQLLMETYGINVDIYENTEIRDIIELLYKELDTRGDTRL